MLSAVASPVRLQNDCDRLLERTDPKSLHTLVMTLQEQEFPGQFDPKTQRRSTPNTDRWVYYAPSWHFSPQRQLFTSKMIQELRAGASLLSVGAGPAYTELLLVRRFGVNPNNIVLADLPCTTMPQQFSDVRFDMHQEWPALGRKFSYVVFPESILVGLRPGVEKYPFSEIEPNPIELAAVVHVVNQALRVVEPQGELRIETGRYLDKDNQGFADACRRLPEVLEAICPNPRSPEPGKDLLVIRPSAG